MKSLYEILGIDRESDGKEIKAAYRRKSQQEHPDKGGTEESFHAVSTAYAVLSDPERRQKYDETGDIEESNKGNLAEQTLVELFEQVISQEKFTGNIITQATSSAIQGKAVLESQILASRQKKRKFEKLLNRINSKSEINLFSGLLAQKIDALDTAIEQISKHLTIIDEVLELLKDYDDTSPVIESALGGLGGMRGLGSFGSTSTGTF